MVTEFDKRSAELSKLPRSERFEKLISFPTSHTFKVIGEARTLPAAARELLDDLGHQKVIIVERPSAKGAYVSLTFDLRAKDGRELDVLYCEIEKLQGLKLLI